ncbi:MAG: hypothetical protein ACYCS7_16690 [Acidimicrobiales bacterium]
MPLEAFYPAEEYHRDYFNRNTGQGYCRIVIAPKLQKFRKESQQINLTSSDGDGWCSSTRRGRHHGTG